MMPAALPRLIQCVFWVGVALFTGAAAPSKPKNSPKLNPAPAGEVSVTITWTASPPSKVTVVDGRGMLEFTPGNRLYSAPVEVDRLLAGVSLSIKVQSSPANYSLPIRLRQSWRLETPLKIQVPTENLETYCNTDNVKSITSTNTTDIVKLIRLMIRADWLLNLPRRRCGPDERNELLRARFRFNRTLWEKTEYIGMNQQFSSDLRGAIRQQAKVAAQLTPTLPGRDTLRRVANVKPSVPAIASRPGARPKAIKAKARMAR
jgi:hypothetical protein